MESVINEVLVQSPLHVTADDIKTIIEQLASQLERQPTVTEILAIVWKLPDVPSKVQTEWDERRRIVDEIEELRKAYKASKGEQ